MQIYIISISHTLTPFHVNNIIINCSCKNQVFRYCRLTNVKLIITRMWANAQRDGRPAKYRWFPLFNAAKFGWRPLLECRAVTLRRRESVEIWKRAPNSPTSQPLVGWSSPYCEDTWGRHCCLTIFSDLVAKIKPDKIVRWWPDGEFLATFLGPAFAASRVQHISDLHSKFALGPRHV